MGNTTNGFGSATSEKDYLTQEKSTNGAEILEEVDRTGLSYSFLFLGARADVLRLSRSNRYPTRSSETYRFYFYMRPKYCTHKFPMALGCSRREIVRMALLMLLVLLSGDCFAQREYACHVTTCFNAGSYADQCTQQRRSAERECSLKGVMFLQSACDSAKRNAERVCGCATTCGNQAKCTKRDLTSGRCIRAKWN